MRINPLILASVIIVGMIFPSALLAYVASSTNYRLEADSINFGGGEMSSSTSYSLSDTFGEAGTGAASSTNYNLHAGYRAMETGVAGAISLTPPDDVVLESISGDGGTSADSAVWTVSTTNSGGYELAVKAGSDPALANDDDAFADYEPAGAVPDYDWSVASNEAQFGFTPEGDDISDRYLDSGGVCGTGSNETDDACWDGFSTSNRVVAERGNATTGTGSSITLLFKAEIGADAGVDSGDYTAAITVTATTL